MSTTAAGFAADLVQLERSAAVASAQLCQCRLVLEDRTKPFVQRYGDADVEPLTWFHSRDAPESALIAVFASLAKRIHTFDAATGRAAVVLMRRYSEHTGLAITTHMVHRLFLAALVVASKAHHDHVVRNQDVAKIFGIHRRELHRLEAAFCVGIDWRAQVTQEDLRPSSASVALAPTTSEPASVTTTTRAALSPTTPTQDLAESLRSATGDDTTTTTPTPAASSTYVAPYALSLSFAGATGSDGDDGISPSSRLAGTNENNVLVQ